MTESERAAHGVTIPHARTARRSFADARVSERAARFGKAARLRSCAHRYGVYRYFLIFGLFTFALVTIAEPVP